MNNFKIRALFKIIVFLSILIGILNILSFMTTSTNISSRIMMHELYNQEEMDVAFLGASRFYRGINPYIINDAMGTNSFDVSSAMQGARDMYYMAKETYRYHSPKMVVIDASWSKLYDNDTPQQSYIVLDYMKPSWNKFLYLFNVFDLEQSGKAVFPILRYDNKKVLFTMHSINNLKQKLTSEWRKYDYTSAVYNVPYSGKGLMVSEESLKDGKWGKRKVNNKWDFDRVDDMRVEYFEKTIRYCKEKGSDVILMNPPRPTAALLQSGDYADYVKFLEGLSLRHNVPCYNFELVKKDVFDLKESYFYDTKHMNSRGAALFSPVLSEVLTKHKEGTLKDQDYFYSSLEEMLDDLNRVLFTWLVKDKDVGDLVAVAGGSEEVEYQFLYKPWDAGEEELDGDDEEGYVVYREYNENPYAELSLLESGDYKIRVNARTIGSTADFEQYYIYKLKEWGR